MSPSLLPTSLVQFPASRDSAGDDSESSTDSGLSLVSIIIIPIVIGFLYFGYKWYQNLLHAKIGPEPENSPKVDASSSGTSKLPLNTIQFGTTPIINVENPPTIIAYDIVSLHNGVTAAYMQARPHQAFTPSDIQSLHIHSNSDQRSIELAKLTRPPYPPSMPFLNQEYYNAKRMEYFNARNPSN